MAIFSLCFMGVQLDLVEETAKLSLSLSINLLTHCSLSLSTNTFFDLVAVVNCHNLS